MSKSWGENLKYSWRPNKDFGVHNMWALNWKENTRSSQSCNFGKILQCWKNLGMLRFSRLSCWHFATTTSHTYLPPCVLQWGGHHHIKETRNIWGNKLETRNNNILFWLKVWLSRNQFEPVCLSSAKNQSKLPCIETGNDQLPKQVHRSPRRLMKDNGQGYL